MLLAEGEAVGLAVVGLLLFETTGISILGLMVGLPVGWEEGLLLGLALGVLVGLPDG